jgi:hypothetical protein
MGPLLHYDRLLTSTEVLCLSLEDTLCLLQRVESKKWPKPLGGGGQEDSESQALDMELVI